MPIKDLPSSASRSRKEIPANASRAVSASNSGPLKFGRKPFKQSSLRKSINLDDDEENGGSTSAAAEEDDPGAPVVVRPSSISRSGSTKLKKRVSSSRLSFGPGENAAIEREEDHQVTPKKTLGQRALENNALKKATPLSRLPTRSLGSDDDRPRYSKEYLEELQSSTPNTPQNLSSLHVASDDDMDLDPSELDGALVVESTDLGPHAGSSQPVPAAIPTETEILAKKSRRARLALERDAMALDDDAEDENSGGQQYISLLPRKKKPESRLIAEDEDLGEGYDEFVEDGGISLGRKAERAAAARHRAEMAALIDAAEGGGSDGGASGSDSSDAERRAAYEAAQTRAGMDGLQRPGGGANGHGVGGIDGAVVIPRMKPLPELEETLARMRALVQGLQDDVARKRGRIADLEREKGEISAREAEVQEILNQAGTKYQAVVGGGGVGEVAKLVGQSPHRALLGAFGAEPVVERGLESFGTTPTTRPEIEDLT